MSHNYMLSVTLIIQFLIVLECYEVWLFVWQNPVLVCYGLTKFQSGRININIFNSVSV